jgi:hypothetical protein
MALVQTRLSDMQRSQSQSCNADSTFSRGSSTDHAAVIAAAVTAAHTYISSADYYCTTRSITLHLPPSYTAATDLCAACYTAELHYFKSLAIVMSLYVFTLTLRALALSATALACAAATAASPP